MFIARLKRCCIFIVNMIHVVAQLTYGIWRISKLPQPIVSIFGGTRMPQQDKYALQANKIGHWLIENNISLLTGGGPGIMQAANCGAFPFARGKEVKSIGIGVRGLEQERNSCVEEYFELDYFWARKWLLTQYSIGFVVFPGGFGTLDELSEVLTLIQTGQLKSVPIVLIGKEYWAPFMEWVTKDALQHDLVTQEHVNLLKVTDDEYQAFCFVQGTCKID